MPTTKKPPVAILVTIVALVAMVLVFAMIADSPAQEKQQPKLGEEKHKAKVEHKYPVSPGIQALAAASTDIIVADVVDTNPRKAEEGARDTVKLKVVRTMLGLSVPGDTLGVYYHLSWADEKAETLELPKFEKGLRYVVFLTSHIWDHREEGKRVVYDLTDPWLAVLHDRPALVSEIATAVRVTHGDARGEWSESVGPLQSRLVAYRTGPSNGTPIITVYLDVRNVAGGDNTVEFNLDKASVTWIVTDAKGKDIAPTRPPGNSKKLPTPPQKRVLEAHESARFLLSMTGAGIAKDRGGHLELGSDLVWVFDGGDEKKYYLNGTIKVEPTRDRELWSGTIDLPRVKVPMEPQ
jgi:hypothetical protein